MCAFRGGLIEGGHPQKDDPTVDDGMEVAGGGTDAGSGTGSRVTFFHWGGKAGVGQEVDFR